MFNKLLASDRERNSGEERKEQLNEPLLPPIRERPNRAGKASNKDSDSIFSCSPVRNQGRPMKQRGNRVYEAP